MGRRTGDAQLGTPPLERATADADDLKRQVRALQAQVAALQRGRGRFALERDAASRPDTAETKLRARAERAEAQLADLRRDSARAINGLRQEVTFWQLVAQGVDRSTAAKQAGLTASEPAKRPPC